MFTQADNPITIRNLTRAVNVVSLNIKIGSMLNIINSLPSPFKEGKIDITSPGRQIYRF
jgi:hypothetical protein